MKIRRFVGRDMRTAMAMVREQLGPEAVILGTRSVPQGMEVVAAADFETELVEAARQRREAPATPAAPRTAGQPSAGLVARIGQGREAAPAGRPAPSPARAASPRPEAAPRRWALIDEARGAAASRTPPRVPAPPRANPANDAQAGKALQELQRELLGVRTLLKMQLNREPKVEELRRELEAMQHLLRQREGESSLLGELRAELDQIRSLVQDRLASLSLRHAAQVEPQLGEVLLDLLDFGLPESLARELIESVPRQGTIEQRRRAPWQSLERMLPVRAMDPLAEGGVVALIGSPGSGKTTTAAKLAARYAERFGPRDVALVAIDDGSGSSTEALCAWGRRIGVPARVAKPSELPGVLRQLAVYRLVIVDAPGVSLRAPDLERRLLALRKAAPGLRTMLVLNATAGRRDAAEQVRRHACAEPDTCILTHVDEWSEPGAALGAVIAAGLPIGWVSEGQRVPEDLSRTGARELMLEAMRRFHELRRSQRQTTPHPDGGSRTAAPVTP